MRAHAALGGTIVVLAGGPGALAGGGAITEFEHNAAAWHAAATGETLAAFEQVWPGLTGSTGCLAGTPGASIYLPQGVIKVSRFDSLGVPGCAVSDGSTPPAVSDGSLSGTTKLVMDFSPPVNAFYTYYGSLASGTTATMTLYADGVLVGQLVSAVSTDNVLAGGHGFVSDVLIDHIEFTTSDAGGVLVGAFVGLLGGEGSLGTVAVPGGGNVTADLGVAFVPDCNNNGIADAQDIAQGGSLDANGNGLPDECEFSGALNGTVVWPSGRMVYIADTLLISGSLTINPGCDVVLAQGGEVDVQPGGHLTIAGTQAQPVRLRPSGSNRWNGIQFLAASTGTLRHAELEHLATTAIGIVSASPKIEACTIRDVTETSGAAYGIRISGASNPALAGVVIQGVTGGGSVAGGPGINGSAGSDGTNGGGSQQCANGGFNGSGGSDAGSGSPGGNGSSGGDAFGVSVEPGAAVRMASCRINSIRGGDAGNGGNGGLGGPGGDGGNGTGGLACGGDGGSGGPGGNGGKGGMGGHGGGAFGVYLDHPAASVVAQTIFTRLIAGSGGDGGNGGAGGQGGNGGNGAFNALSGGNGAIAGPGGDGGDAGDGGNGGSAEPISVHSHTAGLVLSQNTVGGGLLRGNQGVKGARGFGGPPGAQGQGAAVGGQDGGDNVGGVQGNVGINGSFGLAVGIHASSGTGPIITASNNVVVTSNDGSSVGLQADGGAGIQGDFNCFFDVTAMISGNVVPGGGSFVADPQFVDANGVDDLPGTEDDNFRLAPGSPCVNTGGGAQIPPDAADLDGDSNTAEALPLDAAGNPRVSGGTVDRGAYEFGSVACPWDLNANGVVDTTDFLGVLQQWGTNPGGPPDFNGDGVVNTIDFLALLQHWAACP